MANQAMCLAMAAPGDRVVVARTSHRSVLAGLVLAGLDPVWVSPEVDPATGLALAVPPERVPAAAAAGRVAAETISPYPPGIPAIAPGELLTTELLDALRDEAHAGGRLAGASDPTLETLLVVRS